MDSPVNHATIYNSRFTIYEEYGEEIFNREGEPETEVRGTRLHAL
jgi:hypothetical protein